MLVACSQTARCLTELLWIYIAVIQSEADGARLLPSFLCFLFWAKLIIKYTAHSTALCM